MSFTSEYFMSFLQLHFPKHKMDNPGRAISRMSDINFPASSCDLIPLDYFLLDHAGDRASAKNSRNIEQLQTHIREIMADILFLIRYLFWFFVSEIVFKISDESG